MKKVTKKQFNDAVKSVVLLLRENKSDFLSRCSVMTDDTSDRLEYVESVESLLLSLFMVDNPNCSHLSILNDLREQIKNAMC